MTYRIAVSVALFLITGSLLTGSVVATLQDEEAEGHIVGLNLVHRRAYGSDTARRLRFFPGSAKLHSFKFWDSLKPLTLR